MSGLEQFTAPSIGFTTRDLTAGLRRFLATSGMSQAEAARRCQISQPQFNGIVNGRYEPKLSTCVRVAHCLRQPIGTLFGLEEEHQ